MSERGASIGKDFVVNPEGVDVVQINKDMFGHQLHEASKKGNAGSKKVESKDGTKETKQSGKQTEAAKAAQAKKYKDTWSNFVEKDPLIKEINEVAPIKSPLIEAFIADHLERGKTIQETAGELKKKIIEGKNLDNSSKTEATRWLTAVAIKTNDPELIVEAGKSSSKFSVLENQEYPEITLPLKPEKDADQSKKDAYNAQELLKKQQENLIDDAETWKEQLEGLAPENLTGRSKTLQRALDSLVEGKKPRDGYPPKYQKEQAEKIKKRITEQMNQVEAEREAQFAQREIKRSIKNKFEKEQQKIEWAKERVETGRTIERSEELARIFHNPDLASGLPIEVSNYITMSDLELLLSGEEGQWEWLARFRREKMTTAEAFKMGLHDQSKWDNIKDLLRELWGKERGDYIVKRLNDRLSSFEDVDSVTKGIEQGPKPGKVEDQTKVNRYLTSIRAEALLGFEQIDLSKVAFTESLKYFMQDIEMVEYQKALETLMEVVETRTVKGKPKIIRNIDIVKELHDRNMGNGAPLSAGESKKLNDLNEYISRVGHGVLLRDYHMIQQNNEAYTTMFNRQQTLLDLDVELNDATTIASRKTEIQLEQQKLTKEITQAFEDYTLNPHAKLDVRDTHTVKAIEGLSPIQIEARDRVIAALKSQGKTFEEIKKMEWKIYESLWAAKSLSVGLGEAMEISAKLGRCSSRDLRYKLHLKDIPTGSFMNRGYAETHQRVLNPDLFADDFRMGDALGDEVRNIYYKICFKLGGYDFFKDKRVPQEWKDRAKKEAKNGTPEWVTIAEYAETVLGISYSETVRPELLVTGLQQVSSNWRAEEAELGSLRKLYQREENLPEDAKFYLQGLGYRFNMESGENRVHILQEMMKRKPSVFFDLIGKELPDLVKGTASQPGIVVGSDEWQLFRRSLATAEIEMWRNETYRFNGKFDFADAARRKTDFDPIMAKAILANGGEANREQMDKFFNTIVRIKEHMNSKSVNGEKYITNWANHKFQHTYVLTNTDFDWSKFDISRLGLYSLERRINDFNNQANARDAAWDVLYKTDLLAPVSGKETDTLKRIKEHRDAIVNYSGMAPAEVAQTALLETVIEWNRLRTPYSKAAPLAFIPGAVSFLRRAGMLEKITDLIGDIKGSDGTPLHDAPWFKKLEKWPRSLAQAVSYDVKWGGHEGNAWDEYRVAGFLAGAETSKMYVNNTRLLRDLQRQFHTGFLNRAFYALPRKYWWVVPVATIAIAAGQSLEEEKKK